MISELLNLALPRAAWVLGFILAVFLPCLAEDTPKFEGTSIQVPPAQTKPWTPPPTKLGQVVVSAITTLFNEGLADPRGCDYREIEITAGLGEGDVKTHGWV